MRLFFVAMSLLSAALMASAQQVCPKLYSPQGENFTLCLPTDIAENGSGEVYTLKRLGETGPDRLRIEIRQDIRGERSEDEFGFRIIETAYHSSASNIALKSIDTQQIALERPSRRLIFEYDSARGKHVRQVTYLCFFSGYVITVTFTFPAIAGAEVESSMAFSEEIMRGIRFGPANPKPAPAATAPPTTPSPTTPPDLPIE